MKTRTLQEQVISAYPGKIVVHALVDGIRGCAQVIADEKAAEEVDEETRWEKTRFSKASQQGMKIHSQMRKLRKQINVTGCELSRQLRSP